MRTARIIAPAHHEKAYYHCISRIVNREFVLHEQEKEQFVGLMRKYEKLYGLRVVTYCIMSNHFHILVEVPQAKELTYTELIALVTECLGEKEGKSLSWRINHYLEQGNTRALEELIKSWHDRMWNISSYMKILKQRFSQWFNKAHKRTGTLWETRFHSTLVQAEGRALKTMAAYIDLNPVRAKMCEDPKDYRWSGYGEAVAGDKRSRSNLHFLTTVSNIGGLKPNEYCPANTAESLEMWRRILFGAPENPSMLVEWQELQVLAEERAKGTNLQVDILGSVQRRLPKEKALEVLANGGKLSQYQYLGCRMRYFCDGAAIGAKSFIEEVFQSNREKFGKTREDGARKVEGLISDNEEIALHTLREFRNNVFG